MNHLHYINSRQYCIVPSIRLLALYYAMSPTSFNVRTHFAYIGPGLVGRPISIILEGVSYHPFARARHLTSRQACAMLFVFTLLQIMTLACETGAVNSPGDFVSTRKDTCPAMCAPTTESLSEDRMPLCSTVYQQLT